jgi:hypothetical protein
MDKVWIKRPMALSSRPFKVRTMSRQFRYSVLIAISTVLNACCSAAGIGPCASVNPYELSEGEGAYFENREIIVGKTRYHYIFIDVITSEGKKDFGYWLYSGSPYTSAPTGTTDKTTQLPAGVMSLGLNIYYFFPKEKQPEGQSGEPMRDGCAEARAAWEGCVEIAVINAPYESPSFPKLELTAVTGTTYRINSKIEDGTAFIWIEDETGKQVSNVVRGLRYPYGGRHWSYWETLPEPGD